jgi:acyl-CoA reductase-like NAD-dependent aldehyde dehydrogenase
MSDGLICVSPVDGSVCVERDFTPWSEIEKKLDAAQSAQAQWRRAPLGERKALCAKFVDAFAGDADAIAAEITMQMGRPIRYTPGEVAGTAARARAMIGLADEGLADVPVSEKAGFRRFIRRESLGTVLTVPAWNYPYLIAVNSVIPALLAGNAVLLKHSAQTPLCADRFAAAFDKAGFPPGLFDFFDASHDTTAQVIGDDRINYLAFTGSVEGGHAVSQAAAGRFIGVGLELGGKDPAYVRADADVSFAVENLVDGAFFNSGQSCCGIERIYVHEENYEAFVDQFAALTREYVLGDPRDAATTLGPLAKPSGARAVRSHIADALNKGATSLVDAAAFAAHTEDGVYMAPQVLVGVDHSMKVMMEETFGPVVGIMKVKDDAQAIGLMNDSPFGLTASLWSQNEDESLDLAGEVETGTCFLNRCDFLDPELAWVGIKDSGRGCTLSRVGFEHLTRPKSFHLKAPVSAAS